MFLSKGKKKSMLKNKGLLLNRQITVKLKRNNILGTQIITTFQLSCLNATEKIKDLTLRKGLGNLAPQSH